MPGAFDHVLTLRRHLEVVHHVPGRIRLRFHRPAKGETVDKEALKGFLAQIEAAPAIRSVRLSPATLSAVVEYDPHALRPGVWSSLLSGPEDVALAAIERLAGHPVKE